MRTIKGKNGYEAYEDDDGVRNLAVEPAMRVVIRTDDVYQTEVEKGVAGYPQRAVDIAAGYDNAGALENPDGIGMAGRSKRGENYCQIYVALDPTTGTIAHATFRAHGSLGMIASASLAATLLVGLTPAQALARVTDQRLRTELGGPLPRGGAMCPLVAAEAVRAAVGDVLYRQGADLAALDAACPCDTLSTGCLMCEICSLRKTRVELALQSQAARSTR